MRFPVTVRHRSSTAKIYAPAKNFTYYRLAYATAGKRRMQTFPTYPEARKAAERVVKELANGSQAAALSASQSRDALAAFERLETAGTPLDLPRVKTALPPETGMLWSICQSVKLVVPRTVACAAPGALRLNVARPSGRRVTDPALIVGASMMLKGKSETSNMTLLVALVILMV